MTFYPSIGIEIPTVLLPKKEIDLQKWAVIACDQFTSEPEYWQEVEQKVGDAPSTLRLILPEVYLCTSEETERIKQTQKAMQDYLEDGLLEKHTGLLLVERVDSRGHTRRGLILALDLERYDYSRGSQSLIRATEGTIVDRLPPRIRIRKGAPLELPHILVLIDDPKCTVIEPLFARRSQMEKLYEFDLMLGSGKLTGHFSDAAEDERSLVKALEDLSEPACFQEKYGVGSEQSPLLFAMGDGNHSLATAKSIWEQIKGEVGMDHPARYALVEIENVHDDGLEFEPIHRVLFGVEESLQSALQRHFGDRARLEPVPNHESMIEMVDGQKGPQHRVGVVTEDGFQVLIIEKPESNLPVGSLQGFLDSWCKLGKAGKIDYVHGEETVTRLCQVPGNLGFYLPAMPKNQLFKTVILDGVLPRKTFSMGEAKDKRFYIEARRIA